MRGLASIAVALLISLAGVRLVVHYGSNGGPLAGLELPAFVGVGLLAALAYYRIARSSVVSHVTLLVRSFVVAVSAPLSVLFGPMAFCMVFLPGASCM